MIKKSFLLHKPNLKRFITKAYENLKLLFKVSRRKFGRTLSTNGRE